MNSLVDRIYVHAKIHALHGYLLSKEDYQEIVRLGKIQPAFPDIAGRKEIPEVIHIKETLFRDTVRKLIILTGLNDYYSDFFRAFLVLFELSNIKNLLLRAYGRTALYRQWNDVSPYNIIDNKYRSGEIGLDDVRPLFEGTVFSTAMDFEEPPAYEELESRIDFLALKNLAGFSRRLRPADLGVFNDILVRRAVSLKILWDMRRETYHGYVFPQPSLMDLFRDSPPGSVDIGAVEKEIKKRISAGTGAAGAGAAVVDIPGAELSLNRHFILSVQRIFTRDFHSIRPVLSYTWSLYYQILNLFMIIEGLQLGVDPDEIMRRLVCGD